MRAFITGSHAYGTPSPRSDVDLVILADDETANKLRNLAEPNSQTVRFGKLNLIVCRSEIEFAAWLTTTKRLQLAREKSGKTFDKKAAHAEFEKDRRALDIEYKGDSGPDYSPEDAFSVLV